MPNLVKISVIIPVYNVEEYLVKCLDSVVNQTLKEIEIICINDGSTDNSLEILNAYAKRDSRIVVIDKENEGQGIARNIGIQTAKGEYLAFVDPDDWIAEEMFETMYNQACNLSSDIVICDYLRYREWDGKSWKPVFFEFAPTPYSAQTLEVPVGENINKDLIYKSLLISPCYSWNRLYRTELLKKNSIFYSEHRCYEDVLFIFISHILAENISYVNKPFYIYRMNKKSTLGSMDKRYFLLIEVYRKLNEYIKILKKSYLFDNNLAYFLLQNSIWTYRNLPKEEQAVFYKLIRGLLPKKYLPYFKKKTETGKLYKCNRFLQQIFSVTNTPDHKVFNIVGIKMKFRYLKGSRKLEKYYIDKIKKNQKKYPKDTYILFDCLHDSSVECIDAYSLFKYMQEKGLNAYYVLLKESTLYQQLVASNDLGNIIGLSYSSRIRPDEFIKALYPYLLRAKAVITSFGENSKTINTFFKENKYWKYIFIQHGQIFLKERVLLDNYLYQEKFDKFLISSDMEYKIFKKYKWSDDKLLKSGLPRWDLLPKTADTSEKSILFMFTWRNTNIMQFETSLYKKNLLKLMHNEQLHKYLKEQNVKLYFAPHHALSTNCGIDFQFDNKNIEVIDSSKISEAIRKCSCLVTDFSSVAFDFMFQDKPVLCYLLDKGDVNLNKYDKKDIERFEYKQYILPNVTYSEDELIEKIKFYVERDFKLEPEVKEKYDKFFYIKENIREDLTQKITEICS